MSDNTVHRLMSIRSNIRNVAIIAQSKAGKTTLAEVMVAKSGNFTDQEEKTTSSTIKSSVISLPFVIDLDDLSWMREKTQCEFVEFDGKKEVFNGLLVNLLDTPGHSDFAADMTAALRVADGAILVQDIMSGMSLQTESVLRRAIVERIRPVLFVNKVDRALLELKLDSEALFKIFHLTVEKINFNIATYGYDEGQMGVITVDPSVGNVGFGSGLHGWGFTLKQFAEMYSKKFGVQVDKLVKNLWGERFFNLKTKKWSNIQTDGSKRGFCQFVLDPILKISDAVMNKKKEETAAIVNKLGIKLTNDEKDLEEKPLMEVVMRKWLPAGDTMLQMITLHLPSPVTAQRYRMEMLYEGPHDDEAAVAIKNCDPNGPLMIYVSKMVPTSDKGRFYAFGRVFSGKVSMGLKVRIQGPNYVPGKAEDLYEKIIQGTVLMMGSGTESVEDIPSGNVAGLVGVDEYLVKGGTITTFKDAHNIRVMKFSVSPVVRVCVEVIKPADLPKLVEGLRLLAKSDPLVQCVFEESGKHIIAGAGELHLSTCLSDLENDYACISLKISDPFGCYRETVEAESNKLSFWKSPTQKKTFYCSAACMPIRLAKDIEEGKINAHDKTHAKVLSEVFNIDSETICCFGPDGTGPNLLIDVKRRDEVDEACYQIDDSIVAGFREAVSLGIIAGEIMHGVCFKIYQSTQPSADIMSVSSRNHKNALDMIQEAFLRAKPTILEPVYLVELECLESAVDRCLIVLYTKRGRLVGEKKVSGTRNVVLRGIMPIHGSSGFADALKAIVGAEVNPQFVLHAWMPVVGEQNNE